MEAVTKLVLINYNKCTVVTVSEYWLYSLSVLKTIYTYVLAAICLTWYCDYLTQFGRSLSHPGHTHSTTSLTGSVTTPGGPSIPSSLHNMPGSQGGNLSSQSARWKAIQVLKYCNKNLLGFYSEMFFITNKFLKVTQSHLEPIRIPSSVTFAVIR